MMDRHSNQDQRGVITDIENKSCWHKINSRNHEKELLWQWNSQGYHIRELAFLEVANCKLHSSGDSNSSFRLTWAPSYRSLSYTQCSLWVITGSKEFVGTQLPSWEKDTMKETWVIQYRNSRLWARQIRETLSPRIFSRLAEGETYGRALWRDPLLPRVMNRSSSSTSTVHTQS